MSDGILLAVAGAHLQGQPLNHQLTDRGGVLVRATVTAPCYRLFALATEPPKPGVVRVAGGGVALGVEVWRLDPAAFGDFVAALPQPMAIGRVELADGSLVSGFLVEPIAVDGAADISRFGGWREYLAASGS
ncbi:allophanate hydrolase-related protein [Agromyces bauzanensis]